MSRERKKATSWRAGYSEADEQTVVIVGAKSPRREQLLWHVRLADEWSGMYEVPSVFQLMLGRLPHGTVIIVGESLDGLAVLKLVNWTKVVRPDLALVYLHRGRSENDPRLVLIADGTFLSAEEVTAASLRLAITRAREHRKIDN